MAKEDDGALVVFFDENKLPPCIVQKKDGSFLYSTSDLATIKYRKEKLNVEMPITDALYKVLFEGSDPREMVSKLLQRDKKSENY